VVLATINRFGLRGTLPVMPKPAGRVRIVALGGSTTFGYAVADGEDWPSQLGRRLGDRYDVVNGGRPGATTFRNFAYLRDHLLKLEPDVVVLYEGFNDMWRAVRRHAGDQPDYGIVDEGLPASDVRLDQGEPARWPWRISFVAYRGARWLSPRLGVWKPSWPAAGGGGPLFSTPPWFDLRRTEGSVRLCRNRGVQRSGDVRGVRRPRYPGGTAAPTALRHPGDPRLGGGTSGHGLYGTSLDGRQEEGCPLSTSEDDQD
jgi:hypothetical protein